LDVFSGEGSRETENPSLFLSLEEHSVSALSAALVVRDEVPISAFSATLMEKPKRGRADL
jgi:hypothetical protein